MHLASLRRWEPGTTEPHCSKERGFAVLLGQEWVSANLERSVKAPLSCPLVPKHHLSLEMRMAVGQWQLSKPVTKRPRKTIQRKKKKKQKRLFGQA